jgi:hypothetical protein
MPMSLEGGEDGNSSRRPSYSIHVPQLYPYTLSEDDTWAEGMVANILAVRPSSLPPPVLRPCVHPGLLPLRLLLN